MMVGDERIGSGLRSTGNPGASTPVWVLTACKVPLASPKTRYESLDNAGDEITGAAIIGGVAGSGLSVPVATSMATNTPLLLTPKSVSIDGVGVGVGVIPEGTGEVGAWVGVGVA